MEKTQIDLSVYRMEKAKSDLGTAEENLQKDRLSQSINRSYYAMFHAARALLALDKLDSRKHSGIISFFNQIYIKPGKIEREFFRMLADAFDIRNESDYNDFYIAVREDAQIQLENAKKFLKRIQEYIDTVINEGINKGTANHDAASSPGDDEK
jgi:uncharacterized protein (UPF0332 family)